MYYFSDNEFPAGHKIVPLIVVVMHVHSPKYRKPQRTHHTSSVRIEHAHDHHGKRTPVRMVVGGPHAARMLALHIISDEGSATPAQPPSCSVVPLPLDKAASHQTDLHPHLPVQR